MQNNLNRSVKVILDLCFYIGLILEILVPVGLKYAVQLIVKLLGDTTEYAKIFS